MTPETVSTLTRHPWLADAVRLRRWDDLAKVPDRPTRRLEAWAPLLQRYFALPRRA